MINRQNWLDVRDYLRHIERERQCDHETVRRVRAHLRHLLEWADETPLSSARSIDPTYPNYILTARSDGQDRPLSPASIVRGLLAARQFYGFARVEWPHLYKPITESWISSLQAPRDIRQPTQLPVHQYWTLEDVYKVANVSAETLREERARAGVCMMLLTGARGDVLASVPIHCVDVARRELHQFPSAGVRTKNRKAAITYLLDIPDLLQVVERWDQRVRRELTPQSLWYSTLTRDGMSLTSTTRPHVNRVNAINKDIAMICAKANVPYLSSHKLRHGHVVHALKQARDFADLKAISQNIMHSTVVITDKVYGQFTGSDVRNIIANLGKTQAGDQSDLTRLLELIKTAKAQGLL